MNFEHFGEWLAYTRKRRKMTQAAVANATGLNATYISKIERNEIDFPRPGTREKFHMALDTSEEDLVDLGWLERIDSMEPGGQPFYVEVANITPGDRAAEAAHRTYLAHAPSTIFDASAPPTTFDAADPSAGLRTQLHAYGLTDGQVAALLAMLDAFTEK